MKKSLLLGLALLLSIKSFAGPGTTCHNRWMDIIHPYKLSILYVKLGHELLVGADDWSSAYLYFEKAKNIFQHKKFFSELNAGICTQYMRLNSIELSVLDGKQKHLLETTVYGINIIDGIGDFNTFSNMVNDLQFLTGPEINGL